MLGNYAHTQTVDIRPFLSEWEGPGYEATPCSATIHTLGLVLLSGVSVRSRA